MNIDPVTGKPWPKFPKLNIEYAVARADNGYVLGNPHFSRASAISEIRWYWARRHPELVLFVTEI